MPLLEALARSDDGHMPIAEVCRRVGDVADVLGLTRPSYERIRELAHIERSLRQRKRGPTTVQLLLEAGAGYRSGPSVMRAIPQPRDERR